MTDYTVEDGLVKFTHTLADGSVVYVETILKTDAESDKAEAIRLIENPDG